MSFAHTPIPLPNLNRWKIRMETSRKAREAADQLIQGSRLKSEYFVMCLLSGLIATLGILLDDIPLLIAAMVLAPLLNPVLSFAAGLSLLNTRLTLYAATSFFGGILFVVAASGLFVKLLLLFGNTLDVREFSLRFQRYDVFLLLSAFLSGFAAVYSWLRPVNQLNLIGIAIAVSLIPGVSFFGVLLGIGNIDRIQDFLFAFSFNLFCLIFGAVSAFLLLGFRRVRDEIRQEEEDLHISE
ncbi:DUF389 domain-containing protein [Candidatus Peregrinibacteria bacterium]|nr:MAG: DUF389 domain-containing protein [Candidatus Peregrinibacteria bacterium]